MPIFINKTDQKFIKFKVSKAPLLRFNLFHSPYRPPPFSLSTTLTQNPLFNFQTFKLLERICRASKEIEFIGRIIIPDNISLCCYIVQIEPKRK